MKKAAIKKHLQALSQLPYLSFTLKYLCIALAIGVLAGSASAFFLVSLNWATEYRENNLWVIALLPLGGLIIGYSYHWWGAEVVKGNNLVIEEYHNPKRIIRFRMAPLVLFGTVATHLFGGSAGREGTAVQMGAAIADRFTRWLSLDNPDRKILLIMGVSAGFASVFGTPLAGAVFAMEVMVIGRIRYEAIFPALLAAVVADYTCHTWSVVHTQYNIPFVPDMSLELFLWAILAGICFGLAALLFSKANHFWAAAFRKAIGYSPLRPFAGGMAIALFVYCTGTTRYIGLGVPIILDAFSQELNWYDFLVKTLTTSFTLGAGFKGGEVTPLFYVGATLGNAISNFVPLPIALLAGMGFVGVFSGATNTPIACTLMGIELFGIESGVFIAIACFTAYLFSGHSGIYEAQTIGSPKHSMMPLIKEKD